MSPSGIPALHLMAMYESPCDEVADRKEIDDYYR